jgi:hypothetical protein
MTATIAFNPGYGGTKVYGPQGGLNIPSAVSVGDSKTIRRMVGLRSARPPLRIETEAGAFYIGDGAHDWGRPMENLDFDRLGGAPEMLALFLGAMTRCAVGSTPVNVIVGLPIATLMGEDAGTTKRNVRSFLRGAHSWGADGVAHSLGVEEVLITSQPVGAMFDYLLTDEGAMTLAKRTAFRSEIGILGIGMNTVDLLVVRNGAPVQRFTAGETLGVRRLLDLVRHRELYSVAELDAQLRASSLDVGAVLPVWQSEVLGFVERQWGRSFRQFDRVVTVGGGAVLLRKQLLQRFKSKAFIPDDPIITTARGLYKYTLMGARRSRKRGEARTASQS